MNESPSNASKKLGLPPGSLIHIGEIHHSQTKMTIVDYSQESIEVTQIGSLEEILKYNESDTITWVIIEGLTNIKIVARIGELFNIHQLVLEDILNTNQRPKFEEYDDYLYIVLKCLLSEDENFTVNYEQVSLLVLKNFVFMFKEKIDDIMQPVIQRIKSPKSRFRSSQSDYLAYAILDIIVDQNFILIDDLDDAVTDIEDKLLTSEATLDTLHTIQKLKREMISIRKNISPLRELMAGMLRSETDLIHEKTQIYLRDVSDHALRVTESIESYRDILSSLVDIYISSVSNKMNEVMKVLTVFASIFIPLTFLAGIYGMNFEYMPELKWKWALSCIMDGICYCYYWTAYLF